MGHNIELLRKQEKNSRKPSEDLTKYSQKVLPCFAEKKSKSLFTKLFILFKLADFLLE